jgi:hypothetical protein
MTVLTIDVDRKISCEPDAKGFMGPLEASEICFQGSLLSRKLSDGYIHRLVAGEAFVGICGKQVLATDWKTSNAASGDVYVLFAAGVGYLQWTTTGLTQQDAQNQRLVYASDDNTFTLVASSSSTVNNTYIGKIVEVIGTTIAIIQFVTDEGLPISVPGIRGVVTYGTGTTTLTTQDVGKLVRKDGSATQSVVLPLMSTWIGKSISVMNALGGGVITISSNATDSTAINGAGSIAQTDVIGQCTTFYNTGNELCVIGNA